MHSAGRTIWTLVLMLAVLLVAAAVFQAMRVVQPSEVLPGLTAIDASVEQMRATNHSVDAVRQARSDLEGLVARTTLEQTSSRPNAALVQRLQTVSASLAIAEAELSQQALRLTTLGAEIGTRVKLIKDQIGPPTTVDRLAGNTIKDLLIAFAWPLSVVIGASYLLVSSRGGVLLQRIFRHIRSLKVPGLEVVVGEELKETAEEAFKFHREQVKKQFDSWAQRQAIRETVNRILEEDVEPFLRRQLDPCPGYRCTIHVPDILFADSLYQLIDYAPMGEGPRGRAWSVRYGMMGKQWRLGSSGSSGEIPTNVEDLIRDWGMTRAEAREAGRRQSLVCAILQPENRDPVGIFYLDAANANAFGTREQAEPLLTVITQSCKKHGLVDALAMIRDELRKQAPLIQIYG